MTLDQHKLNYVKQQKNSGQKFWERLSGKPDFRGSCVLEVGCGCGSLSIDIALSGAKKVIGLDINPDDIAFAREYLRTNHPNLTANIEYVCLDLKDYVAFESFDYVISKDSFEHMLGLESILSEIKTRLKKKGKIYVGFGPLYLSCFGDHGKTKTIIPWGHLIIPEKIILKRLNKKETDKITSIKELGLNKLTLQDYSKLFKNSGLSVTYFKTNCGNNLIYKLFSLLSKIGWLKEHFTQNIYCILEKP